MPLGLSANALARDLHVPPNRITAIIAREDPRAVTPDTGRSCCKRRGGATERVAAVAAFGDELPAAAAEALDTLDDRVGHADA